MTFSYTHEQLCELEGLAYRIADTAFLIERYGHDAARHGLEENHKTIKLIFERLDALHVPFWVQNAVMARAEDWRRYKSEYMNTSLKMRGIYSI